jgi:hypothetical protein
MTLEGWDKVVSPLVMAEPYFTIFLFGFIIIFTFGMLNMVVAMVVEKTMEQARMMNESEQSESNAEFISRMRAVFMVGDTDCSGTLTAGEFYTALTDNAEARNIMNSVGIRTDNADVLFAALDADGTAELTLEELLQGCARIRGTGTLEWDILLLQSTMRRMSKQIQDLVSMTQAASCCSSKQPVFAGRAASRDCHLKTGSSSGSVPSAIIVPGGIISTSFVPVSAPPVLEDVDRNEETIPPPCANDEYCMPIQSHPSTESFLGEAAMVRLESTVSRCTEKLDELLSELGSQSLPTVFVGGETSPSLRSVGAPRGRADQFLREQCTPKARKEELETLENEVVAFENHEPSL